MMPIGIIGAMQEEIELLQAKMTDIKVKERAGIHFFQGSIEDRPVVLCKSGVGKVNAAICTQLLIDDYSVRNIIFTGVAGSLHPDLQIGDIVISTDCMQHDMDVTALGYDRGVIPFQEHSCFAADEQLKALAYEICSKRFSGKTMLGRILSGDQFVADRLKVKQLFAEMNGACVEMEGASVAQVCHMNKVAFVIIRCMSDRADGSAHHNFTEFTQLASQRSSVIVEEMIKAL